MMVIKSYDDAISTCVNIMNVMDQLTVKGRNNCLIVAGVSNDIDALARFIQAQRPVQDVSDIKEVKSHESDQS